MSDINNQQPLFAHLVELRNRILKSLLCVLVIFLGLFYFANDIYLIVAKPLTNELLPIVNEQTSLQMDESATLNLNEHAQVTIISTGVIDPFIAPFKLAFVLAFMLSVPYILHQLWGFISPGLYQHEKKFAVPLLFSSVVLFYLGIAFAYFVVLPLAFAFFTAAGPTGISYMPDISNVLSFILTLFFAFGVAFEIPIATFLLVLTGVTNVQSLSEKRPYIFLGCFVVGMLVTPPDIFSQTILAIPMWLLFEAGVIAARLIKKEQPTEEEADAQDNQPEQSNS